MRLFFLGYTSIYDSLVCDGVTSLALCSSCRGGRCPPCPCSGGGRPASGSRARAAQPPWGHPEIRIRIQITRIQQIRSSGKPGSNNVTPEFGSNLTKLNQTFFSLIIHFKFFLKKHLECIYVQYVNIFRIFLLSLNYRYHG